MTEAGRTFTERTTEKVATRLVGLIEPLDALTRRMLNEAVAQILADRR